MALVLTLVCTNVKNFPLLTSLDPECATQVFVCTVHSSNAGRNVVVVVVVVTLLIHSTVPIHISDSIDSLVTDVSSYSSFSPPHVVTLVQ